MMAPQTLQVLLCVTCKAFQVHIVKKSNKWSCKICSTKQSVQRVFGTGTGTECRLISQRLNLARGEVTEAADIAIVEKINQEFAAEEEDQENNLQDEKEDAESDQKEFDTEFQDSKSPSPPTKKSKWAVYLEENNDDFNHLY